MKLSSSLTTEPLCQRRLLPAFVSSRHRTLSTLVAAVSNTSHAIAHAPSQSVVSQSSAPPSPPCPITNTASEQELEVQAVDLAILGGGVTGLLLAHAALKAQPGIKVQVYVPSGTETQAGGGVMLHKNGLDALHAIDPELFTRVMGAGSGGVREAFIYDTAHQLLKQTSLLPAGLPRQAATRRGAARGGRNKPPADPPATPRVVQLALLQRLLMDALPPGTVLQDVHMETFTPAERNGPSLLKLRLAKGTQQPVGAPGSSSSSREGDSWVEGVKAGASDPFLYVRATLVVGADTAAAQPLLESKYADSTAPAPRSQARVLWRGTVHLRRNTGAPMDPARLRAFPTATRMFLDLAAPQGSERIASLSPAGPDTFTWSASCPLHLLPQRGLCLEEEDEEEGQEVEGGEEGGSGAVSAALHTTPYQRVQAMFEDFPEDVWASLKLTREGDVVEELPCASPLSALSQVRWANTSTALAGSAAYSLPSDDPYYLSVIVEDAAVLGAALQAHGATPAALQSYAAARAPRVQALLTLPASSPEKARLVAEATFEPLLGPGGLQRREEEERRSREREAERAAAAAAAAAARPPPMVNIDAAIRAAELARAEREARETAAAAAAGSSLAAAPADSPDTDAVAPVPVPAGGLVSGAPSVPPPNARSVGTQANATYTPPASATPAAVRAAAAAALLSVMKATPPAPAAAAEGAAALPAMQPPPPPQANDASLAAAMDGSSAEVAAEAAEATEAAVKAAAAATRLTVQMLLNSHRPSGAGRGGPSYAPAPVASSLSAGSDVSREGPATDTGDLSLNRLLASYVALMASRPSGGTARYSPASLDAAVGPQLPPDSSNLSAYHIHFTPVQPPSRPSGGASRGTPPPAPQHQTPLSQDPPIHVAAAVKSPEVGAVAHLPLPWLWEVMLARGAAATGSVAGAGTHAEGALGSTPIAASRAAINSLWASLLLHAAAATVAVDRSEERVTYKAQPATAALPTTAQPSPVSNPPAAVAAAASGGVAVQQAHSPVSHSQGSTGVTTLPASRAGRMGEALLRCVTSPLMPGGAAFHGAGSGKVGSVSTRSASAAGSSAGDMAPAALLTLGAHTTQQVHQQQTSASVARPEASRVSFGSEVSAGDASDLPSCSPSLGADQPAAFAVDMQPRMAFPAPSLTASLHAAKPRAPLVRMRRDPPYPTTPSLREWVSEVGRPGSQRTKISPSAPQPLATARLSPAAMATWKQSLQDADPVASDELAALPPTAALYTFGSRSSPAPRAPAMDAGQAPPAAHTASRPLALSSGAAPGAAAAALVAASGAAVASALSAPPDALASGPARGVPSAEASTVKVSSATVSSAPMPVASKDPVQPATGAPRGHAGPGPSPAATVKSASTGTASGAAVAHPAVRPGAGGRGRSARPQKSRNPPVGVAPRPAPALAPCAPGIKGKRVAGGGAPPAQQAHAPSALAAGLLASVALSAAMGASQAGAVEAFWAEL